MYKRQDEEDDEDEDEQARSYRSDSRTIAPGSGSLGLVLSAAASDEERRSFGCSVLCRKTKPGGALDGALRLPCGIAGVGGTSVRKLSVAETLQAFRAASSTGSAFVVEFYFPAAQTAVGPPSRPPPFKTESHTLAAGSSSLGVILTPALDAERAAFGCTVIIRKVRPGSPLEAFLRLPCGLAAVDGVSMRRLGIEVVTQACKASVSRGSGIRLDFSYPAS